MSGANPTRSASDILAERKRKKAAAGRPAPHSGLAATALSNTSYRSLTESGLASNGAVAATHSLKEVRDARRSDAARAAEVSAISLQQERRVQFRTDARADLERRADERRSNMEAADLPMAWKADGWSRLGEAPPRDTLTSPVAKDAASASGPVLERKPKMPLTLSTKRASEAERPPIAFERNVMPRAFDASAVSATAVQNAARAASRGDRPDSARPTPYVEEITDAAEAGAAVQPGAAADTGLGPTKEVAGEIKDGVGEKAFRQRRAAEALLKVLPPGSLPVAGGASSRVPVGMVADQEELQLQRLIDLGGMTGDACNKIRLFLQDWEVGDRTHHAYRACDACQIKGTASPLT